MSKLKNFQAILNLLTGGQTESDGLSKAHPSFPCPPNFACHSKDDSSSGVLYALMAIVKALQAMWLTVLELANLSNPYLPALHGYLVHATRNLVRSRPAIIG
ncbi:hypothetical protein RF11_13157 [Thelohanellus kitauei]|uniref:Uncharacterized protein n=1 Tax=Thelohanellus kitauei TaxID=669202 RepID=A0A0C2N3V4_THEKT|nr:hypothetical protein RF11_13157 [Thelohanellus kitauei]